MSFCSYVSAFNGQKFPRIQLRTIERPSGNVAVDETFKKRRKRMAGRTTRSVYCSENR